MKGGATMKNKKRPKTISIDIKLAEKASIKCIKNKINFSSYIETLIINDIKK